MGVSLMSNKYIHHYAKNNLRELRRVSDYIINKQFTWLPQMYYDDFYGIAGDVLCDCASKFDESSGIKFETFLINCLKRKFMSKITYMNRKKRNNGMPIVSLDSLINEESGEQLIDMIADKSVKEIHPLVQRYLDSLTSLQRKVAELMMEGYDSKTIKIQLKLSDDKFKMICQRMRSEEKLIPLNKLNGVKR